MNLEELKVVSEMLATLGQTGSTAFIWWLIANYGTTFVTHLFLIFGVTFSINRGIMFIGHTSQIKEIYNSIMGTNVRCGLYDNNDHSNLLNRISELKGNKCK